MRSGNQDALSHRALGPVAATWPTLRDEVPRAFFTCTATNGVPTIWESYGVSSLTDSGVGFITVNLSPAMPDASYAVLFSGQMNTAVAKGTMWVVVSTQTSTEFDMETAATSNANADYRQVYCMVVRD